MDQNSHLAPLFSATITPNRSLGKRGYQLFMGFFILYCVGLSLFFLTLGWWPIIAFLGLDLVALWLAFKICYQRSNRKEHVLVTAKSVIIRKVDPKGHEIFTEYTSAWSRLAFKKGYEEGQLDKIFILYKQEQCEIAADLSHREKFDFYKALKCAMQTISQLPPLELSKYDLKSY